MDDKDVKALSDKITALEAENSELKSRNAAMELGLNRSLAVSTVGHALREAGILFSPKLLERTCSSPVIKEGKLDDKWLEEVVRDFSDQHHAKVTGMGTSHESASGEVTEEEKKRVWKGLGVPEAGLSVAIGGGR